MIARMSGPKGRMILQFSVDSQNDRERPQIDVPSSGVENLRYQATIGQCDFIADAVLSRTGRKELLDGSESPSYEILSPLVLFFLTHVDQHHQVLQRLDTGRDHFADLSDLGTSSKLIKKATTIPRTTASTDTRFQ